VFSFFNINKKMLERVGETPHFSALFVLLVSPPKKQQQEMVLEELANGQLVTVLCRRNDMPSLNTLQ
jgi:hypothetical protein